jgi:hypothetical protein
LLATSAGFFVVLRELRQPAPPPSISPRVAYLEFGLVADRLWLAEPARPERRQRLLVIPHAPDFGAVPSLSPDGARLLYNVLAPETASPSPDSPADLWLASLDASTEPVLLARGVDLLVEPLWAPNGAFAVVRRSRGDGDFRLVAIDLRDAAERELVASGSALFPIGFEAAGSLLYALLDADGSHLHRVDLATAQVTGLATLSPGLTRDWALSPDGTRVAYLELSRTAAGIASQAYVLDLGSGQSTPASATTSSAFGPAWTAAGKLALGYLVEGRGGGVSLDGSALTPPARGFDVPLAFAADGRLAVRSFAGASLAAPGEASLVVIDGSGKRSTIGMGEVTFLGWTNR